MQLKSSLTAPYFPTSQHKETTLAMLCQPWPCCAGDKRPGELGQLPLREAISATDLRKSAGRLFSPIPTAEERLMCSEVSDDDDDGGWRVMKGALTLRLRQAE